MFYIIVIIFACYLTDTDTVTVFIDKNSKVVFTTGSDGTIKLWNLPSMNDITPYGDTNDGKNYCIGTWTEANEETFWDIRHHPFSVNYNFPNFIEFLIICLCQ